MPKGPRGEKRPADVIGAAILVGRIATREAEDTVRDAGTEANRKGGLKGGKARAEALTADERHIVKLIDDTEAAPEKRGPYKTRGTVTV